jgi:hypothetical protein
MEYIEWGWFAIKCFFGIWVLSYFVRIFLPSVIAEKLEQLDYFIFGNIAAIPVLLSNIWFFTATILYFLGNFSALVLIAFGMFMVGYSVHLQWAEFQPTVEGLYKLAKVLVDEKAAWSGATVLIAATVAVGHMWKLNLDRKQYFEKKERELLAQLEKKRNEEHMHLKP